MGKSFDKVIEALEAQDRNRHTVDISHVSPENREAAITAHELFVTLLSGGFTESQAAKIVAARIAFAEEE